MNIWSEKLIHHWYVRNTPTETENVNIQNTACFNMILTLFHLGFLGLLRLSILDMKTLLCTCPKGKPQVIQTEKSWRDGEAGRRGALGKGHFHWTFHMEKTYIYVVHKAKPTFKWLTTTCCITCCITIYVLDIQEVEDKNKMNIPVVFFIYFLQEHVTRITWRFKNGSLGVFLWNINIYFSVLS